MARWDLFISCAGEDKHFARNLAQALQDRGISVWFDEFVLRPGDNLSSKIEEGLASSRYGVVILSKHFFEKKWPLRELDSFMAMESTDKRVLLPIYHSITPKEVREFSPKLASRVAVDSSQPMDQIVRDVLRAMDRDEIETDPDSPIAGPLSVYIDSDAYTAEEKGELLSLVSQLYALKTGDRLIIDGKGNAQPVGAAIGSPGGAS